MDRLRESDVDRARKKALLRAQLRARGDGAAQVLGPFDGRDGAVEYTVTPYTGRDLRWEATLRGDYPTLHARIAALPPPAWHCQVKALGGQMTQGSGD